MVGSLAVAAYEAMCGLGRLLRGPRAVRLNHRTGMLEEGWIIANHKLVAFHAAFLSSLFMLTEIPGKPWTTGRVLEFMFAPWGLEVWLSAVIWYLGWHVNIAIHELGHYVAAVKTSNLRPELMAEAEKRPREEDDGSLGSADGYEVEGGVVGDSHGRLVPELTTESGA